MPSIHMITCICQFGEHYIKAHALIFIAVCVQGSITDGSAVLAVSIDNGNSKNTYTVQCIKLHTQCIHTDTDA